MLNQHSIKIIGEIAHALQFLRAFGDTPYLINATQQFVKIVDHLYFYRSSTATWKAAVDEMNCLIVELRAKINPL
jgi:hypothetical protein